MIRFLSQVNGMAGLPIGAAKTGLGPGLALATLLLAAVPPPGGAFAFLPLRAELRPLLRSAFVAATTRVRLSGADDENPPSSATSETDAETEDPRLDSLTAESVAFDMTEDYDSYSRCLTPREERDAIRREDRAYAIVDAEPRWQRSLKGPVRRVKRVARKFGGRVGGKAKAGVKPGALILLRCGESAWNANQTFTGWADPPLTVRGESESSHAARLLLAEGYEPDVVYTSRLKRAIGSVTSILREIDGLYLPVYKSWRLNERVYGTLTGLSKRECARRLGSEVVQAWRNSLKARPPPMKKTDPFYHGNDPRYSDLAEDQIPLTESLLDCMDRARPLWEYKIRDEIRRGNNVLVVAHANTLRGLIKVIDSIGDEEIQDVAMPTGIPFVYRFDRELNPLLPDEGSLTQVHASGMFLEKPGLLKEALQRQEEWESQVPGFGSEDKVSPGKKRVTTLEESLLKLREEQEAEKWVAEHSVKVDGKDMDAALHLVESRSFHVGSASAATVPRFTDDPSEFEDFEDEAGFIDDDESFFSVNMQPLADEGESEDDGPVVVLIRHGRTPHNNLGLFTGWEDPPLAPDGVEDAKNAGKLLRRHNFKFDVLYTSWLTRAIETGLYVLDELDLSWIPVVKSWRLNERMYGALTGKSKKMIANIYGEDQLKKWRRGFTIQPPPTSSYSLSYPGNDYKRTKYVKDIRVSFRETLFRSLEQRKFQMHRKFPKTESLKDCMDRSIPFYTERILKEAVDKDKRVLITSHENAIRGILMHLCGIPQEAMNQLHLPNGLPLVYSVKGKCISLLDDGSGKDPMEVHDFGPAAKYLFKPCELTDDFFEEMEKKGAEQKKETVST